MDLDILAGVFKESGKMSKLNVAVRYVCSLVVVSVLLVACPTTVQADLHTYDFARITNNSPVYNVASQLSLSVEGVVGGTDALFTLSNAGPVASAICDVYFDDSAGLLDFAGVVITGSGPGVVFVPGANPADLPGGGAVGFSADHSVQSPPPPVHHGVGPGEWLKLYVPIVSGSAFEDVIAALDLGAAGLDMLRVGLHVQGLPDGQSDGYVHTPVPGALLLGMIGLTAAGFKLRRFA